jgi:ribonuclease HI
MDKPPKQVMVYTDGACLGNPGPGGYGVVLVYGKERKELSGGFSLTTNNRMELTAAIVGLEALKSNCSVTLWTDSQYLVNGMNNGWARKWKAKGWMRTRSEKALNADLWEKLLALCERHDVRFHWIRGHAGHPENERCDRLATDAAKGQHLPPDTGYDFHNR